MKKLLARLALVLMVATLAAYAAANAVFLRRVFQPERKQGVDTTEILIHSEKVSFETSDGITLKGSLLRGHEGAPAIVFCHDRGQDRTQVLPVALLHNGLGYTVLVFDFRAHGQSGGSYCTLGVMEREDVLAAVTFLRGRADVRADAYGLWGIGMGAYAAFVAGGEAHGVQAVAVNFIYPDPRSILRREYERLFRSPMGALQPAYERIYQRIAGCDVGLYLPRRFLEEQKDRQVLFVVAADDPEGKAFVEDELYPGLDATHRTLIKIQKRGIPAGGSDKEGYELNTMQFFKGALPL